MISSNRTDEDLKYAEQATKIMEDIINELKLVRHELQYTLPEIKWRVNNTKAMLALNLHQSKKEIENGIKASEEAIKIAPYAYDVKANLGSLNLLLSRMMVEKGKSPAKISKFAIAKNIFEELNLVGWDPGFVKFRLGIIRRAQGRFDEAIKILEEAKEPSIIDVPEKYINRQIKKAKEKNK